MKVHTNSAEETQHAGKTFAKKLHGGDVILLYGNLGAGKTTFVQGLAKGLGIEKRIISPTFIIVRRYEIPSVIANEVKQSKNSHPGMATTMIGSRGRDSIATLQNDTNEIPRNDRDIVRDDSRVFYHIDLYRTQTEDDVKGLGIDEILEEKDAIVAIEWPEKLGSFLPKKRWELRFENLEENVRETTIEEV
jgi:tRNA threonylcarbamoyladenosine biosynthesis protein TsaE